MTEASDPADVPFTEEDFEKRIDALSKMAHRLTKGQWGILLSIFAAAAGNVNVDQDGTGWSFSGIEVDGGVIEDPRHKEVETLRRQLLKARMPAKPPGNSFGDMVSPPKAPPVPPPPPPPGQ